MYDVLNRSTRGEHSPTRLLISLISALTVSSAAALSPVQYSVTQNKQQVRVIVNGQVAVTVDFTRGMPTTLFSRQPGQQYPRLNQGDHVEVAAVADLDNDGNSDALIVVVDPTANGGIPGYAVLSFKDGKLSVTQTVPGWERAVIESWKGRPVIRIRRESEGVETLYSYQGGKLTVTAKQPIKELFAQPQVRFTDFSSVEENKVLRVNLGGSAVMETITCSTWERWSQVLCGVKDGAGRTLLAGNQGCYRFGVLTSKTKGYLDLVCGSDVILRWNGAGYVFPKN